MTLACSAPWCWPRVLTPEEKWFVAVPETPGREQFIYLLSFERDEQMGNHYIKVKQVTADRRRWDVPEKPGYPLLLHVEVDAKRNLTLPLLLPIAFF